MFFRREAQQGVFDYIDNQYNQSKKLVLETPAPPAGMLVRYIPYSTSIVVDLPGTAGELRARRRARFWSKLGWQQRKFQEAYGPLQFQVVTAPEELEFWLPQVQALFADRWRNEYTSIPWKTAKGFRPYHDAMIELARKGGAGLSVLHGDHRLLSFAYCLARDEWYYFYQHAATPEPRYRTYSVGKQLLAKLLLYLTEETDYKHLDLMLGDMEYKRDWESWRRTVYVRLESPATAFGHIQLAMSTMYTQAKLYVQFSNPTLRAAVKSVLSPLQLASISARKLSNSR